jgi:hypothetical protein
MINDDKRHHLNGSVMAAQRLGRSKFFMGAHTAASSIVNSFCVSARAQQQCHSRLRATRAAQW